MDAPSKVRVVGRRSASAYSDSGLKGAENLLQTVRELRGKQPFVPFGVYRFKTHEEADEWLLKMLTRPNRAPQP